MLSILSLNLSIFASIGARSCLRVLIILPLLGGSGAGVVACKVRKQREENKKKENEVRRCRLVYNRKEMLTHKIRLNFKSRIHNTNFYRKFTRYKVGNIISKRFRTFRKIRYIKYNDWSIIIIISDSVIRFCRRHI